MIYITVALGVLFAVAQAKTVKTTNDTELRKYEVIKSDGIFEIRYYPPAIVAAYKNPNGNKNDSFRMLAGYIFGGNKDGTSIAMTSPVEMERNDDGEEMRFTMPAAWDLNSLPEPNSSNINIDSTEGYYAATVRYDGYSNSTKVEKYRELLTNWMTEQGLETDGHMVRLGYNPPYQVVNRRNEILYRLENYSPGE